MNVKAIICVGIGCVTSMGITSWLIAQDMQEINAKSRAKQAQACKQALAERAANPDAPRAAVIDPATGLPVEESAPTPEACGDDAQGVSGGDGAAPPNASTQVVPEAMVDPSLPDGSMLPADPAAIAASTDPLAEAGDPTLTGDPAVVGTM